MITEKKVCKHFEKLFYGNAIYLWGANCQVITKELTDRLYLTFKSSTYDKDYYNGKFIDGKGKIGADCSGSFYAVSGYDTTAAGYYSKCAVKGDIKDIPRYLPCQVFKTNSSGSINHIGWYMGDGTVIEMKSSNSNCVRRQLDGNGWDLFGIPAWVTYSYKRPLVAINRLSSYQDVAWLQTKINNALKSISSFIPLKVDGDYKNKTQAAVIKFYELQGWKTDGLKVGIIAIGRLAKY